MPSTTVREKKTDQISVDISQWQRDCHKKKLVKRCFQKSRRWENIHWEKHTRLLVLPAADVALSVANDAVHVSIGNGAVVLSTDGRYHGAALELFGSAFLDDVGVDVEIGE